jgi:hypothetical protein
VIPTEAHSLTEAVATWAKGRTDLRAVGLAGSWARGTARSDSDSDLDLLILSDAPAKYRSDPHWLYHIALPKPFRVVSHKVVTYGVVWSSHAKLDPTAELELSFAALGWASTDPLDAGTRKVINDGFKVIVDKDGHLRHLVEAVQKAI